MSIQTQAPVGEVVPKLLLTVEEARHLLSIGYKQMYALLMRGEIASITIGRSRRIPRVALDEFIARRLSA